MLDCKNKEVPWNQLRGKSHHRTLGMCSLSQPRAVIPGDLLISEVTLLIAGLKASITDEV